MNELLGGAVSALAQLGPRPGSGAPVGDPRGSGTLTPRCVYLLALTGLGDDHPRDAPRAEGARVAQEPPRAPRRSFAEKLEGLFHSVTGPRGEYTLDEVAAGIRDSGGPTISASYIWQLRKGIKDNPTKKHMEALADFFGVPVAYFHDDDAAARIEAELETLTALRDAGVRRVALRAAGLSPQSLAAIASIIESARQVEGLGDGDYEDDHGSGTEAGDG